MISLRDLRPDDEEMIYRWRNMPEVVRYMYTDRLIDRREHEGWFRRIQTDPTRRHWIITCDQEEVGVANLYAIDPVSRRCHWAFYIASPKARGKGVGTLTEYFVLQHVFEELNFNRLCCEVLSMNESVIRMHKEFGFVQEGVLRQHVMKEGRFMDVVSLAMLRQEWSTGKSQIECRMKRRGLSWEEKRRSRSFGKG